MSWKDNVSQSMIITCGDGQRFYPLFKNPRKRLGMSSVAMEYNETEGAEVIRGSASYRVFPTEIYFQGDDHLEVAQSFENSARDRRPWKVFHPYYGDITAQPTVLNFNNSGDNVTVITFELWETVESIATGVNPSSIQTAFSNIEDSLIELTARVGIESVDSSSAGIVRTSMNKPNEIIRDSAVTDFDVNTITSALAKGESYLNNFASNPLQYMNQLAFIFRAPARYYATATNRINVISRAYENLKNSINGTINLFDRLFFEAAGGMAVNAVVEAAVTKNEDIAEAQDIEPILKPDYRSRRDVLKVSRIVNEVYNDYITTLSQLQSDVDNKLDSYYPEPSSADSIKRSVKQATGNLYLMASKLSQERVYTLNEAKSLMTAIHFVTGKTDHKTVTEFIDVNDLTYDEMLIIPKGRNLRFWV